MQISRTSTSIGCFALLAFTGMAYAASLSSADKQFMIAASRTDMTQAHEGQMAESQATRADVKALGKAIDDDYTQSWVHLNELAAKTGVSIPKGIDASKDRTMTQLVHLKGDRFDRQFASDEVAATQRVMAVFKREADHGKDADVKDYAAKMLPVLENHLHQAEACARPQKKRA